MRDVLYLFGTYEVCFNYAREEGLDRHQWKHVRPDGRNLIGTLNPRIKHLYSPPGYYKTAAFDILRTRFREVT